MCLRLTRRCHERAYLEFHHIHPDALDGPATFENISLRCRRHNQYEALLVFGLRGASRTREAHHPPVVDPCRPRGALL